MDKTTLRSLIVEYRMSGMSFGDITKKLEEHGIKTSRQNVCGIYNRATSEENMKKNINVSLSTIDICNYCVLGLSPKKIVDYINSDGNSISLNKVKEIISKNEQYIRDIDKDIVDRVVTGLENNDNISTIISSIEYKGVKPLYENLEYFLYKASCIIVNNTIRKSLNNIYSITNDKEVIKKLIERFRADLKVKDNSVE